MSLFDFIHCQMPLPGFPEHESMDFQTKSLKRTMEHFTITEDGRLICDEYHYGFNAEYQNPSQNPKNDPLDSLSNAMTQIIDTKDVLYPFTGVLHFYVYKPASLRDNGPDLIFDYFSYFETGLLKKVIQTDPNISEEEGRNQVLLVYEKELLEQTMPQPQKQIHLKNHL